jgi:hypothetical protein
MFETPPCAESSTQWRTAERATSPMGRPSSLAVVRAAELKKAFPQVPCTISQPR